MTPSLSRGDFCHIADGPLPLARLLLPGRRGWVVVQSPLGSGISLEEGFK